LLIIIVQAAVLIRKIDPTLPTAMNFVRQYKGRKVIYDIQLTSPTASQTIRDSFGTFWRKKSGRRLPDELKGISFSNAVTFPTRVRIRLLKELCRRHQQANPTLSCFVTSYLARPALKIRDRKGFVTSLTYVEAVQQLSQHLTHDFLKELYIFAKTNLPEREIAERFLVLTPDLLTDSLSEPMLVDQQPEILPTTSGPSLALNTAILPSAQPQVAQPVASTASPSLALHTALLPPAQPQVAQPVTTVASPPALSPTASTSPTYATLTNVQLTPPAPHVQSQMSAEVGDGTASDSDFTVVSKRNRSRFSKKSAPYPTPR